MKEENFLRRRFSLCPASSTPQKVDPRKLTRNLFFGADNDIYPVSPGGFLLCQCRMYLVLPLLHCFSSTCETRCRTSGAWLQVDFFSILLWNEEKQVNVRVREKLFLQHRCRWLPASAVSVMLLSFTAMALSGNGGHQSWYTSSFEHCVASRFKNDLKWKCQKMLRHLMCFTLNIELF